MYQLPFALRIAIGAGYLILGIYLISGKVQTGLPNPFQPILGVAAILYGVFRMYRSYIYYKEGE